MSQEILMIGYPRCSTCKKAEKYLQTKVKDYRYRNIVDEKLNASEILELWKKSGLELKRFFNTSGMKYRELGLAKKLMNLSDEEKIAILATDGMFVKRPILKVGETICVGFKEKEWKEALDGATENKVQSPQKRSEVSPELCWDLSDLYTSDSDWEEAYNRLDTQLKTPKDYSGKLAESGDTLLRAFEYIDSVSREFEKIYVYAHLKHDEDTADSRYAAYVSRALQLGSRMSALTAYFSPEVNAIPEDRFVQLFEEEPNLKQWQQAFDVIRRAREHTLSDKEERLLAQASVPFNTATNTFSMLNNADFPFPTIKGEDGEDFKLSHSRFGKCIESRDRRVRKEAFEAIYATYGQFRNTFAATLSGEVALHNFKAEARGFRNARAAALFENAIPETVYDNLLETVAANRPLLHRYVALRKKLMNVEELHSYDLYVPLSSVDMEISFEEAKKITLEALKPLGDAYNTILQKAFSEGWIDRADNEGKRSGAYSSGCYDSKPYILISWQNTLDNLYTLVHELGHSVHSYLTRSQQPHPYGDYSIFLAEIASTTNENLLTAYLLGKETDPEKRRHYINKYLDGFKGTVFRQTQFAEFEYRIHEADQAGEALTADFLSNLYGEINREVYGPSLTFDKEIALEWSRIPHFYYDFYVYQYATGFSAATAFARSILDTKDKNAVERYLGFLSAGCSADPLDVLQAAGLDMSVPTPIQAACDAFADYLNQLEALL